jgi:trk system potassium uptake protein TrkH
LTERLLDRGVFPARLWRVLRASVVSAGLLVFLLEFIGPGESSGFVRIFAHTSLVLLNAFGVALLVRQGVLVERVAGRPPWAKTMRAHGVGIAGVLVTLVLLAPAPRLAGTVAFLQAGARLVWAWSHGAVGQRLFSGVQQNPLRALALSFASIIAIATVLLMSPAATVDGHGASLITALFTATSAVCVTGLVVVDTGSTFTLFGQGVILLAIQLGATGVMILAAGFAVLVGGDIPFTHSARDMEVLHETPHISGLRRLVLAVVGGAVLTEVLGTAVLFAFWTVDILVLPAPYDGAVGALYWSAFHAVSAFANAGFALQSDSLSSFATNPLVCLVFALLITLGGLGFVVLSDVARVLQSRPARLAILWERLSLQAKVALSTSMALFIVGTLSFLFFEYDGALRGLREGDKLVAAMFQSVSYRTAGFNTVPFGMLAGPTIVTAIVLMAIGASPGGTGGGMKTTTLAVVVMSVRAMLKNRPEVELFHRTIPKATVYRATAIVLIAGALIAFALMVMLSFESLPFEKIAFEVVSAFGTVGLSMDTTPLLSNAGRLMIVVVMFAGRVGPLSLALAVGGRFKNERFKYAEGRVAVG